MPCQPPSMHSLPLTIPTSPYQHPIPTSPQQNTNANTQHSAAATRELVSRLVPAWYAPGDTIFEQGSIAAEMFFIHAGTVRLDWGATEGPGIEGGAGIEGGGTEGGPRIEGRAGIEGGDDENDADKDFGNDDKDDDKACVAVDNNNMLHAKKPSRSDIPSGASHPPSRKTSIHVETAPGDNSNTTTKNTPRKRLQRLGRRLVHPLVDSDILQELSTHQPSTHQPSTRMQGVAHEANHDTAAHPGAHPTMHQHRQHVMLGEGDHFGEHALLQGVGHVREMHAVAVTACQLLVLTMSHFHVLAAHYPEVGVVCVCGECMIPYTHTHVDLMVLNRWWRC